jgi:hypothetical protein
LGKDIDDGQGSKSSSVCQLIRHEIQTPHLVRSARLSSFAPVDSHSAPASQPLPKRQSLFLIESVHQILPHFPAFPAQQRQNLPVSVTHSRLSDLSDPQPQLGPWVLVALIPVRPAVYPSHPASPALAHSITPAQIIND